jgi:DNA-binding response OmpR family regulator
MPYVRVLLIDDNEDLTSSLKMCLESEGFEVAVAANGEQALKRLERSPADVVVTDLFMPDKDGIETIMELRSRYPRCKIIAMSGWTSVEGSDYLSVARELGAVHTLTKPFDPSQLTRLLRNLG